MTHGLHPAGPPPSILSLSPPAAASGEERRTPPPSPSSCLPSPCSSAPHRGRSWVHLLWRTSGGGSWAPEVPTQLPIEVLALGGQRILSASGERGASVENSGGALGIGRRPLRRRWRSNTRLKTKGARACWCLWCCLPVAVHHAGRWRSRPCVLSLVATRGLL
jgi:hypothetical protein